MEQASPRSRIAVAITGATGAIFGVRVLQRLAEAGVETHLIASTWGRRTIEHETGYRMAEVEAMADVVHNAGNQAAPVASGSFRIDGLIIAPCSARTLAAVAHGLADNLVTRCADVVLKERRRLVLMVRETPLHQIHLENMLKLASLGAVIHPPMPGFYTQPRSIDDLVDQITMRLLDQVDIASDGAPRWDGRLSRPPAPDHVHRFNGALR